MSERRRSAPTAERRSNTEVPQEIAWAELIDTALTVPGSLGNIYNRFTEYSFGNQILLFMQGVTEPVATYRKWTELKRQVKKGSKAKFILRPLPYTIINEKGEKEQRIKGFKYQACLFPVSDTEGEPLPPVKPREWSPDQALRELDITEVPFQLIDGNTMGYSYGRNIAISPVAPYPFKTMIHEVGHALLGHTDQESHADYVTHRGTKEFQAEAVAYLVLTELDVTDAMDASASRAYVQHWMKGERPDDKAIKDVFTAVNTILKAGRVKSEIDEVEA